jgi:hypothetical protein
MKEKSGKYLRWDGNYGGPKRTDGKGLYFDSELRDDYRRDWYLFGLEISKNNKILIKNVKLNSLLYESSYYDNSDSYDSRAKHFIYLYNNSLFLRGFEFQLIKTKNENWFNIRAYPHPNASGYLSSNYQFRTGEQSYTNGDIYAIESTLNESDFAEVMFIEAQNQSISSDNYILGTNLTTNTYYCIQTINDKNETQFLRWYGIEYENYWSLYLHKTNDNQCPNDDKYFFELFNDLYFNWVIIKNKASNKNISIFSDNTFAVTHEDFKDDIKDDRLTLIISNDYSITIRSWTYRMWPEYIYMGTKRGNITHGNTIDGELSYYDSLNFTFIKARNESNNKNSSKIMILFLTIFYFFRFTKCYNSVLN